MLKFYRYYIWIKSDMYFIDQTLKLTKSEVKKMRKKSYFRRLCQTINNSQQTKSRFYENI